MSIGRQFKRVGETGAAVGLWGLIFWMLSSPKRILIVGTVAILLIWGFVKMLDNTGDTYYVNANSLELLDKPFGTQVMTLQMNDSLVMIKEMADNWAKVRVGNDTLFFKNDFYREDGGISKIDKSPYNKWKALVGQQVTVKHPDGFVEISGEMLKNGDVLEVTRYLDYKNEMQCKKGYSSNTITIPTDYIEVDWAPILKRYPRLKDQI